MKDFRRNIEGYIHKYLQCLSHKGNHRHHHHEDTSIGEEMLKDLPWDVMYLILSKLPIGSLGRFRFVSKTWYDTSRNPSLIDSHRNNLNCVFRQYSPYFILQSHQNRVTQLFLLDKHNGDGWKTTKIVFPLKGSQVADTCNGSLCLVDTNKMMFLIVHNPVTKEFMKVPTSSLSIGWTLFGFDSKTNTYKLVRIYTHRHQLFGHIITLAETCWRNLDITEEVKNMVILSTRQMSVFFNGEFYFIVDKYNNHRIKHCMVILDITTEKFRIVTSPPGICIRDDCYLLLVLKNFVTMVVIVQGTLQPQIWQLVDNQGGIWSETENRAGGDRILFKLNSHGRLENLAIYIPKAEEEKEVYDNIFDLLTWDDIVFPFVPSLFSLPRK